MYIDLKIKGKLRNWLESSEEVQRLRYITEIKTLARPYIVVIQSIETQAVEIVIKHFNTEGYYKFYRNGVKTDILKNELQSNLYHIHVLNDCDIFYLLGALEHYKDSDD
jgi:hypothetical protein